jgi:hypothetical protein
VAADKEVSGDEAYVTKEGLNEKREVGEGEKETRTNLDIARQSLQILLELLINRIDLPLQRRCQASKGDAVIARFDLRASLELAKRGSEEVSFL